MTIRQISEFEHMSRRLSAAIDARDNDTVRRLKQEIEEAWNYLLLVDPMKKENVYNMIEFFLDQIRENPEEDLLNQQCKWKILALARNLADNPTRIDPASMRRV